MTTQIKYLDILNNPRSEVWCNSHVIQFVYSHMFINFKGCLRVRTPRVSPTPSPSNQSYQSTTMEEGTVTIKSEDQTTDIIVKSDSDTMSNNGIERTMDSGLTTPVTSPPVKQPSSTTSNSGGRKRRIPLDCITNSNSGSLTPKRIMPVKRTKQITLEILLNKPKSKWWHSISIPAMLLLYAIAYKLFITFMVFNCKYTIVNIQLP